MALAAVGEARIVPFTGALRRGLVLEATRVVARARLPATIRLSSPVVAHFLCDFGRIDVARAHRRRRRHRRALLLREVLHHLGHADGGRGEREHVVLAGDKAAEGACARDGVGGVAALRVGQGTCRRGVGHRLDELQENAAVLKPPDSRVRALVGGLGALGV